MLQALVQEWSDYCGSVGFAPSRLRSRQDIRQLLHDADGMFQNAILFLYCRSCSKQNVLEYRHSSSSEMIYSKSYAISRPGSIQGAPRSIRRRAMINMTIL